MARLYLISILAGSDWAMMYEWADNSGEKMGLVHEFVKSKTTGKEVTGAPKLAYNATTTLGNALRGHHFVKRLPAFNLAGASLARDLAHDLAPRDLAPDLAHLSCFPPRVPAGGAENPRMEATDDFVLSFASDGGDLLLVAYTSASFEHVLRLVSIVLFFQCSTCNLTEKVLRIHVCVCSRESVVAGK